MNRRSTPSNCRHICKSQDELDLTIDLTSIIDDVLEQMTLKERMIIMMRFNIPLTQEDK